MKTAAFLLGTTLLLAGCGYTAQDRALSGGALGAGAGALGGAALGGNPLTGALLGGGGGALLGAVTNPHDVNLGRPVWNNGDDHDRYRDDRYRRRERDDDRWRDRY